MATSNNIPKQGSPSFFKVFLKSSTLHMPLPRAFVRKHLKKIPENPIIKSVTGEHSWRLKIKYIDGDYCFTHGWNKLVNDFKLRFGHFLVFWLTDPSTFKVLIFHKDGCEKEPPSNWSTTTTLSLDMKTAIEIDDEDDEEEREGEEDNDIADENPCFQRVISEKTHKHIMGLPRKFVEEAGIGNKSVVTVRDLEGRQWLMGMSVDTHQSTRYNLSSGWPIFQEYNGLSDGDICLFKFLKTEAVLALAQVIKNKNTNTKKQETPEQKTDPLKRKRGRPPLKKPDVKIEDEPGPAVEVAKRKRGRPPLERPVKIEDEPSSEAEAGKPSGGVKIEIESDGEAEVVKRKRGRPPLVKRKRGRPPLEKKPKPPDGVVEVKSEESTPEAEAVKRKRGRPPLGSHNKTNHVIYF